jgi:hypothetical protein
MGIKYVYLYLHRAIHTGRDTPPGTPTPGLERSQPTGHTHCFKGGERAFKMEENYGVSIMLLSSSLPKIPYAKIKSGTLRLVYINVVCLLD